MNANMKAIDVLEKKVEKGRVRVCLTAVSFRARLQIIMVEAYDQRVCYGYEYTESKGWTYQHTEKKDWLKRGILNRFVAVSGGGEEELCGLDESSACRTIGVAVEKSVIQVSLSVTLMEGNHTSETTTINIETKKISVIGKGRETCSIGTGALSSTR
ncbi:uncharacterized protein MONOS_14792 [Monocercomonoides exilis]|uniref:uncharacterized protein n=1 Tax=Monocercomonoides exilis TaxID=2049356 RepID=UPI003559EBF0|nr:hypothetical protein MONOS_14792 [Monocercomonoides exilis]|eukprot:MONOS_14792.1-p1 / transcript=MONOS_14792.1 / gene=MONOS_14792 / organism=Monocercomonoides_exilis_PA203 / gene_product=unspecified product / transcript_product=unspecified product / location=Mono_scaffold01074:14221-15057(-) / protein_length=157 / sequence_SO=supercontig / SO=protein_coding / is_pseudo=false